MEGKIATLVTPYKGYSQVEIIERAGCQWMVEVCGSGKILYLYEYEFEVN